MRRDLVAFAALTIACPALAQWDPANGDWGKEDPSDLRVITWNVEDALCRNNEKTNADADWKALAAIIAGLKPDVLILQECGDNSGNGTGGGVDSVSQLETVMDLWLHGGTDPFLGGSVTSYVQLYDATYDLPYVFVSTVTDGFNRNVILSRYPFADINGDGVSQISKLPLMVGDEWQSGGTSATVRGQAFAEIDLPDEIYAGDFVIGNAHLKAFSTADDLAARLKAAQMISYFVQFFYNGNGTGVSDPNNAIIGLDSASVLDANTAVAWGGDWNEDEQTNGRKGPAEWMARAQINGAPDGTDKDGTDSTYDDARVVFNTSDNNTRGGSKLDYLCWQDSVAQLRRAFIYRSQNVGSAQHPPEVIAAFPISIFRQSASSIASDHLPVIIDLQLPLVPDVPPPGAFDLLTPVDMAQTVATGPTLEWSASSDADTYDVVVATDPALTSTVFTSNGLATTSVSLPEGTLEMCGTYYWGVTAMNVSGSTTSSPTEHAFDTVRAPDLTTTGSSSGDADYGQPDGDIDLADLLYYVNVWEADLGTSPGSQADMTTTGTGSGDPAYGQPDGEVDLADLLFYVSIWTTQTCP